MKRTGFGIAVMILIGLGVIIGVTFVSIFLINLIPQAIIGTTAISYTCPEGYICEVQPVFECTTPITTGDDRVIFRSEGSYGRGKDIAIDTNDNNILESFESTDDNFHIYSWLNIVFDYDTPEGYRIDLHKESSYTEIREISIIFAQGERFYQLGGNADTSTTPKDNCQDTEVCIGTESSTKYSCPSKEVLLNGQFYYSLSWVNKNNPTPSGGLLGQSIYMSGGETVEYNGEINILKQEIKQEIKTQCTNSKGNDMNIGDKICTSDKVLEICNAPINIGDDPTLETQTATGRKICIEPSPRNGIIQCEASGCLTGEIGELITDQTGYYKCKTGTQGCKYIDFNDIIFCNENEIFDKNELICKPIYSMALNLDKTTLGTSDTLIANVQLTDTQYLNQILIRISIEDEYGNVIKSEDKGTNSRGYTPFTFSDLAIGDYILKAEVLTHPEGTQEKEISFKVVPQINIELGFPIGLDFTQYENNPIKISATSKSGDNLESVIWDYKIKFNGITLPESKISVKPIQGFKEVEIEADVSGEGNLEFEIWGIDETGLETPHKKLTVTVKRASISIPIDISSANNKETGTYTIKFKTLDYNNQLLNTDGNNVVSVILPNTCKSGEFCTQLNKAIPIPNVQGTNGDYTFTWTFENSGLYIVEVSSFASGFDKSQAIPTSVNIRGKTITPTGGIPTMWIVGGFLALIIIFIIGFVFWKTRK